MKNRLRLIIGLIYLLALWPVGGAASPETIHYDITVEPDTRKGSITVSSIITLPESQLKGQFRLHSGLRLIDAPVERVSVGDQNRYRLTKGARQVRLRYSGKIRDQNGAIAESGIHLYGGSYWYPVFDDALVSYRLTIKLDDQWRSVSQGERLSQSFNDKSKRVTEVWQERSPQQEIYLIGDRFYEFGDKTNSTPQAMAFLLDDDPALAERYLQATRRYISMYESLIGPYPYQKFALVENRAQTGYGMPSFTLLGSRVIRLPFILYSSYPHEILHNWWGNSVYIDYTSGNWGEGLTSYLADHLLKEQRGRGAGYRRDALQKYANFVGTKRDFPLTEFRSKHSHSSEAVGYGKTQMLFHMLRRKLGDERFLKAVRHFYQEQRFKVAGFADLERSFSKFAEQDLTQFFDQWLTRKGAPRLALSDIKQIDGTLSATIEQQQPGPAYQLTVPLALTLNGEKQARWLNVEVDQKRQRFSLEVDSEVLQISLDPLFDLFRMVDAQEIPPALSLAFGDERNLIVLPAASASSEAYRQLAEAWARAGLIPGAEIVFDDKLAHLPNDRSVWLFGADNRFNDKALATLAEHKVGLSKRALSIGDHRYDLDDYSAVLTAAGAEGHGLVWLMAEDTAMMANLARKLPHYRKYSYLLFEGAAQQNVVKAQWPVLRSPLIINLSAGPIVPGVVAKREPLVGSPAY